MKINATEKNRLIKRASEYIKTEFTFKSIVSDKDNKERYKVNGSMLHNGKRVQVEITFNREDMTPTYWMITSNSLVMKYNRFGTVELSNKVVVSDPCYPSGTWCAEELNCVRPGTWSVDVAIDEIDSWGERLYILEASHSDVTSDAKLTWETAGTLGVDSGSMSIFDSQYYRRKNGCSELFEADQEAKDAFSEKTWELRYPQLGGFYTCDGKNVGFVCASGCGDGSYPLQIAKRDNEIVGIRIDFI